MNSQRNIFGWPQRIYSLKERLVLLTIPLVIIAVMGTLILTRVIKDTHDMDFKFLSNKTKPIVHIKVTQNGKVLKESSEPNTIQIATSFFLNHQKDWSNGVNFIDSTLMRFYFYDDNNPNSSANTLNVGSTYLYDSTIKAKYHKFIPEEEVTELRKMLGI